MDRRIRKNQEAIMQAFIQLMAEKNLEKITINEIADRADVNRGTVYSHYSDKYDLLDKCLEAQITQLVESCMCWPADDTHPYPSKASLLRIFELMERNAHFYRALLTNKGAPLFRYHLQGMMKQRFSEQIVGSELSLDPLGAEILVQFLSSAIVGVLEWWFVQAVPCSSQEITEQLWRLIQLNQMIQPGRNAGYAASESG